MSVSALSVALPAACPQSPADQNEEYLARLEDQVRAKRAKPSFRGLQSDLSRERLQPIRSGLPMDVLAASAVPVPEPRMARPGAESDALEHFTGHAGADADRTRVNVSASLQERRTQRWGG